MNPPSYDFIHPPSYESEMYEKDIIEKERKLKELEEKLKEIEDMKILYGNHIEKVKKEYDVIMNYWTTSYSSYPSAFPRPGMIKVVEDFYRQETVLYQMVGYNGSNMPRRIYGVITTKGFYRLIASHPVDYFAPIYLFDKNVGKRELNILDQLFNKYPNRDIIYNMLHHAHQNDDVYFGINDQDKGPRFELASRKFESVICLIPGRYKNGKWKQLDGFFGMYYNEETNEISIIPPSI